MEIEIRYLFAEEETYTAYIPVEETEVDEFFVNRQEE